MNRTNQPSEFESSPVDEAIAEYLQAIDSGKPLGRQQLLAKYPHLRTELEDFFNNESSAKNWIENGSSPPEGRSDAHWLEQTTDFSTDFSGGSEVPGSTSYRHLQDPYRFAPYRLIEFIGEGGMGCVFRAADPAGTQVAIKVLNGRWARNPESMKRFKLEGALAGTINHPRCVFVRAVDEAQGQPFIVMELMSGRTLRDLVSKDQPMSVQEAVSKILDVIDGLKEAHSHGVIHRDIKPANCFLDASGRIKLGDFGLARSVEQESDLTQSGSFIGTPLFASPEQIRGESLDYRTDIYSVCATLYYLLTGQAPFGQYSATQVIARIVSDDPLPVRALNPNLPILLESILQKGLQRNREKRFQDLNELRSALEPFVSGKQAVAQLARRFAAYGFDSAIISCVVFTTAAAFGQQAFDFHTQSIGYIAFIHLMVWLYYLVFESRWSATPGKMVMQLRVLDERTGQGASSLKILLRTAVYLLLSSELTSIVIYSLGDKISATQATAILIGGGILGWLIMVIPLSFKRGSRLLQDLLSGTMVVAEYPSLSPIRLLQYQPNRSLGTIAAPGWPAQLGNYQILGLIWESSGRALLSGHDPSLNRAVWIVAERTAELAADAKDKNRQLRSTRLRQLTQGILGDLRWTAYLAPHTAPLRYWVTVERPLAWSETRWILEQLVDEVRQSREEDRPLELLDLDQLWLDSQGRLQIVDAALVAWTRQSQLPASIGPQGLERTRQSGPTSVESTSFNERRFLLETARMALTGRSMPSTQAPSPVKVPLPLHARRLLQSLCDEDAAAGQSIQALQTELVESGKRPQRITRTVRLWMLGISSLTVSALAGAMVSVPRVGNQVSYMKLQDAWVETVALEDLALDDKLREQWSGSDGPAEKTSILIS